MPRSLEQANQLKPNTITKIIPLQQQKAETKPHTHYSIIIYMNDSHYADQCIMNGFKINHLLYKTERFTLQYQITQCYNCYKYGHQAARCKQKPWCVKCSEEHDMNKCKNPIAKCTNCGGPHTAWHNQCEANIAEKKRVIKAMGSVPSHFHAQPLQH